MKFIGDLHIHSHFSLATSKKLKPEYLEYWGRVKGIKVIGTGDFTHPGWLEELREKLVPAEEGLYKLKDEYKIKPKGLMPEIPDNGIRFMLTAEISNIYKKGDKTRKIHNVVFAPDFESVEKIQQSLENIGGNITSDGRPILGLDARDLLEIVIEASEDCFFIPAHIWTPWFSALGDKSGFDSIQACYRDLEKHIHAVETGLSTDAPMHWMCSFLDDYTLISNSDAHSPQKLGRNANIFDTDLSYPAICKAIVSGDPQKFLGTIDMYPQEGKYHYDGHRKCGIRWNPVQTLEHDKVCPKCSKKVTVGVMNRVVELSDRTNLEERPNRLPYYSIIPLKEILSEIEDVGPKTKTVARAYKPLIENLGNESDILLNIPVKTIRKKSNPILAEAIQRMRDRKVFIKEGFDGQYGEITVFQPGEIDRLKSGNSIFQDKVKEKDINYKSEKLLNFSLARYRELEKEKKERGSSDSADSKKKQLNEEQKMAVEYCDSDSLILAGPGTGKTFTLVHKIAYLIQNKGIDGENILAITFTNKAADEISLRINQLIDNKHRIAPATTFHRFGLRIIQDNPEYFNITNDNFNILDKADAKFILNKILDINNKQANHLLQVFSKIKQNITSLSSLEPDSRKFFQAYETYLSENNLFDINDLLYRPYQKFLSNGELLEKYQTKYKWILVDEYQDVNRIQYDLIKLLADSSKGTKICAIGDPNQAIYGFRGADVKYIENFQEDYPDSKIINLRTSYRCTNNILNTSGKLISEHTKQNSLIEGLKKGVKVRIADNPTDKSEAEFVARTIEQYMGGVRFFSIDSNVTEGTENTGNNVPSDFAVLCRTKRQMPVIEKALNDHGIPYNTVGTESFLKSRPINKIMDILKYINRPDNQLLTKKALDNTVLTKPDLKLIESRFNNNSLEENITSIVDRFYPEYKKRYSKELKRLHDLCENFDNLEQFIKTTAISSGQDMLPNRTKNVNIMTLHAAKGLEFKFVFIVGCENKLLPYSIFNQETDTQEERRLLYVGMTRAKNYLYLSYASQRYINGMKFIMKPSPFIEEIRNELKTVAKRKYKGKGKDNKQLSIF